MAQWIAKQEVVDCKSQCQGLVNHFMDYSSLSKSELKSMILFLNLVLLALLMISGKKSIKSWGPEATIDTTGIMEARLQPWLADALAGLNNGMRRADNECIIGIFNLTTQGVLSAEKLHFALQQLTTLCHAYPKTFVGVVVMPNRAGDLRPSPCKLWTYLSTNFQMVSRLWINSDPFTSFTVISPTFSYICNIFKIYLSSQVWD